MTHSIIIYALYDLEAGHFFYVGQTRHPTQRFALRRRTYRTQILFTPLAVAFSVPEAAQKEQRWMDQLESEGEPLRNIAPAFKACPFDRTKKPKFPRPEYPDEPEPKFINMSTKQTLVGMKALAACAGSSVKSVTTHRKRRNRRGVFRCPTWRDGRFIKHVYFKDVDKGLC